MTIYNKGWVSPNDMTDKIAIGPGKIVPPIKTADGTYNEPGLPAPPAGYGKVLPIDEEAMEKFYPDLCDYD